MKHEKTPEEIVAGIPEDMRGHVFALLGKSLHGGAHTADDSGGNSPPPPPPPPSPPEIGG